MTSACVSVCILDRRPRRHRAGLQSEWRAERGAHQSGDPLFLDVLTDLAGNPLPLVVYIGRDFAGSTDMLSCGVSHRAHLSVGVFGKQSRDVAHSSARGALNASAHALPPSSQLRHTVPPSMAMM